MSSNIPRNEPKMERRCQPRVIMPKMAKRRISGKSLKSLTRQSYSKLAAVVYADLFGYPLTVSEAKLWAVRKVRQEISEQRIAEAKKPVSILKIIPSVQAIFLTGSVAAGNAKANADIDLMIVTLPGTLWLTRLIIFMGLKLLRKLKNPYCPNIFLDLNHLEILNKNLYTAHEVLQAQCLYDTGGVYRRWLIENKWVREYLPFVYRRQKSKVKGQNFKARSTKFLFFNWIFKFCLLIFELPIFVLQYLYMRSGMTNESVGWGFAFFHPNNLSEKVLKKFDRRLVKYTR